MKNFFTLFCLLMTTLTVGAQTVILQENFEGTGLPTDWTQQTTATDGGWKFGTASALSGSSFVIPNNGSKIAVSNDDNCNCNKSGDYLIMPELDLSSYTAVSLKFDMFYGDLYYNSQERGTIVASTDGGTTWQDVAQLSGNTTNWQVGYLVDLSAYAGDSSVLIAFKYSDGGGWGYGMAIDNVSVFAPADFDVAVSKLTVPRYEVFGLNVEISGEVVNLGAKNLTSFNVEWSNGVDTFIDEVIDVDIPYLGTYEFVHSAPLLLDQAISYNFSVAVGNPNGEEDANPANNSAPGIVSGVTYIPNKKMFTEEATGTWCGWCPRGTEWMDWMSEFHADQFIGVAVHNGDPMAVTEYDNGVNSFPGFSGYPSVIVDRDAIWDPSELEDILPDYASRIAPVAPAVSAEIDVASRTLTVNASAEFVTQLTGVDFRLNVILSEDNVRGTGSGYNQVNYYSGDSDPIPNYGFNWQTLPNPAPASQLHYNHVGRAILGGWAGNAGSIPANIEAGDITVKEYTVSNFNLNWNPFNMHAVVVVMDNSTGRVLNAETQNIEVICPTDLGLSFTVAEDTLGTAGTGSISVTMANPNLGFGGYTFKLDNGATGPNFTNLPAGDYTITATDRIGCAQEFEVSVGTVSSVRNIESLKSVSLKPNPASSTSTLHIAFDKAEDVQVTVVNVKGQAVESLRFDRTTSIQHTFDLANYAEGIYLVKLSVGNQVHTERMIIVQ